jgi:hypothetical protein
MFSLAIIHGEHENHEIRMTLVAYSRKGVMVSGSPDSPWHQATFFARGTTVKGPDDKAVGEVALCEITDPDGDST